MASNWLEEGNHAGAFIVSEATQGATGVSRSREAVTYSGATALVAGQVVVLSAGAIVPYLNGTTSDANAILFDNVDAGNTTTQNCVVLARDCEVNGAEIVFNSAETALTIADAVAELAAVGIIVRETL